jgi:hypothetical protein
MLDMSTLEPCTSRSSSRRLTPIHINDTASDSTVRDHVDVLEDHSSHSMALTQRTGDSLEVIYGKLGSLISSVEPSTLLPLY